MCFVDVYRQNENQTGKTLDTDAQSNRVAEDSKPQKGDSLESGAREWLELGFSLSLSLSDLYRVISHFSFLAALSFSLCVVCGTLSARGNNPATVGNEDKKVYFGTHYDMYLLSTWGLVLL